MFENHRKCLILQIASEASGQKFITNAKNGQTVIPDRSTLFDQKIKWDILAWFSNTVVMVVKWLDWDFLHWIIQKFFLGPESICIILEVKEKSVVHKALKLEGSTGVHHINHCLVISAQNILFLSSHHAPLLHTCPNGHRQCTSSDWTLLKCKI